MSEKTHCIDGHWIAGNGDAWESVNPATQDVSWRGRHATEHEVRQACTAARDALNQAVERDDRDRVALVERVAERYAARERELAEAIVAETGKPGWEALAEVDLMIAKAGISIEAKTERCAVERRDNAPGTAGASAVTRYRPLGVAAVLGPFNMPGHLSNGHIIPAVLAGNAVVFKASEQAPLVGQVMIDCWMEALAAAGFPRGMVNLVQGSAGTGAALVNVAELDGVFFTGSAAGGIAIHRALAGRPATLCALEMGGNNPLVIDHPADLEAAVYLTIQSAYATAGQRCTCARRLVVMAGASGDRFIDVLVAQIAKVRVGLPGDEPEPYMGTLISKAAAESLLAAQGELLARGGKSLVEMRQNVRSPALLSPGLVDVTEIAERADVEHFGPLLQVIRVNDFEEAIEEANATRYGLAAGLVSDDAAHYEHFRARVRAGIINWNRALTGASSRSPFGGVGLSGNYRPSAYTAADYCAYPVASIESESMAPRPAEAIGFNR